MNFELLHNIELELIHRIHEFRTPFLDSIIKLFDFFDRQEFFFILIPIIWFGSGWKAGLRLFYILLISSVINHVLKEFFALPRPYHIDSSLGIIQVNGYGFPSGAAQTVILLSGILLSWRKNYWSYCIAISYIISVSFSRIYLGIHFPSDILAGWLIGGVLWFLYAYGMPFIESKLERFQPASLFCVSQAIPLALLVWQPAIPIMRMTTLALGISLGLFINHLCRLNLPLPKSNKMYVIRGVTGVIGTFLFYELTQIIPFQQTLPALSLRFFLLGLWESLGYNLIYRRFCSKQDELQKEAS